MTTRNILLLIEKSAHCLSYYDVESGERLHTVQLPDFPHEFTLNADRSIAYIGHYGVANSGSSDLGGREVIALDVAKGEIIDRFSLGEDMNRPHGIGMDEKGRLYALSEGAAKIAVWDTPSKGGAPDRTAPTGGLKSHLFALTKDGRRCYSMNLDSNNVTLFDPHDPYVTPVPIVTGEKPEGRLLRADERVLFVTNRTSETVVAIDTSSLEVTASADVAGDPVRIFHDTKRGRLMTINYQGRSVSVLDDQSLREMNRIELEAPPIAMSFDKETTQAFLSVDADKLHYLDLDQLAVSKTIETFAEPDVSAAVTLQADAPAISRGTTS